METYKTIICNMTGCEFWCNHECLYGGTTQVTPNGLCDAFEPVCNEE